MNENRIVDTLQIIAGILTALLLFTPAISKNYNNYKVYKIGQQIAIEKEEEAYRKGQQELIKAKLNNSVDILAKATRPTTTRVEAVYDIRDLTNTNTVGSGIEEYIGKSIRIKGLLSEVDEGPTGLISIKMGINEENQDSQSNQNNSNKKPVSSNKPEVLIFVDLANEDGEIYEEDIEWLRGLLGSEVTVDTKLMSINNFYIECGEGIVKEYATNYTKNTTK